MIWNCVEERVTIERDNGAQYGRMVRKGFKNMFWNSVSVHVTSPECSAIEHKKEHINVRLIAFILKPHQENYIW